MKFSVIAVIVLVFVAQYAAADWRDDLKESHTKILDDYVDGLKSYLRSLEARKNNQTSRRCLRDANNDIYRVLSQHRYEVDDCVARPAQPSQARTCCARLRRTVIQEVSEVGVTATSCIIFS